jgi:hypothetical protein
MKMGWQAEIGRSIPIFSEGIMMKLARRASMLV